MDRTSSTSSLKTATFFFSLLLFSFFCFVQVPLGDTSAAEAADGPLSVLLPFSVGAFTICLVCACAANLSKRVTPAVSLLAAALGLGLITVKVAASLPFLVPLYVGGFLLGAASALQAVQWIEYWQNQEAQSAASCIAISTGAAFLFQLLFSFIPYEPMNIVIMGVPLLISAIPLDMLVRKPQLPKIPEDNKALLGSLESGSFPVPFFAGLVYCLFSASIWSNSMMSALDIPLDQLTIVPIDLGGCLGSLALASHGRRNGTSSLASYALCGASLILFGWILSFLGPEIGLICTFSAGIGLAFCVNCFLLWLSNSAQLCPATYLAWLNGAFAVLVFSAPIVGTRLTELLSPLAVIVLYLTVGLRSARSAEKKPQDRRAAEQSAETLEGRDSQCDSAAISPAPFDAREQAEQVASNATDRFGLTGREAEVFLLFAQGHTTPFIAERLTLSPHTIKTYLKRIYHKMGISSKEEAISAYHDLMKPPPRL